MDQTGEVLAAAHLIYARANSTSSDDPDSATRPPVYKAIGISLAVASGVFIGISFVLKKIGLLRANEKYDEAAGEGYGYLKNAMWWTGMTLMIIGEICNFVAYAFVDAILVTPLGALSVVITTILSAIFLKERLSMVGKVGCFLCIIGSVVIVMNAPSESSAATIQEMQHFVIAPGFLSYAGVVIIGCIFVALWAGPRYGKKSMLVYLSICSLIGGLSVVATQGLGAAIVAQVGGTPQFNQWFLYVLLVFVITTLVTEIVYLNKALNLFNAALVTPTYYVFFTSTTIITSAILFRGFKGTPTSIVTVVMGFFVICAGVVLLQLSKSAKDVPDTAVFTGDLDQVRTIAEQEQPESEPKADAIRGTAAIVRRLSSARRQMELKEAKRLHEEKISELRSIDENEQYEWDGLRRRKTVYGPASTLRSGSTTPFTLPQSPQPHPPLGMSYFPEDDNSVHDEEHGRRTQTGSFIGTIRDHARSVTIPGLRSSGAGASGARSPMHPVALTEMSLPTYSGERDSYGISAGQKTEYESVAGGVQRRITILDDGGPHRMKSGDSTRPPSVPPTPPPHSAKRQFSFQNVFRRSQNNGEEELHQNRSPMHREGFGIRKSSLNSKSGTNGTEEERLGLVKGDTATGRHPTIAPDYSEIEEEDYDDDDNENWSVEDKMPFTQSPDQSPVQSPEREPRRELTPPRREKEKEPEAITPEEHYGQQRRVWNKRSSQGPQEPDKDKSGGGGAAIPQRLPSCLISGGVAGGVEAGLTYPLEYAKTRVQLSHAAPPRNPFATLSRVYGSEGLRALYTGCSVLVIGSIGKDAVRFLGFDSVLQGPRHRHAHAFENMLAGMAAGVLASVLAVTPMERVKTALIDDARAQRRFGGTVHAVRLILREDGIVGLYRGFAGTTLKQASATRFRMGSYNIIKDFEETRGVRQSTVMNFLNGSAAGIITTLATEPFDTIKTRSQSAKVTTTMQAIASIVKDSGVWSFWHGTVMRLGRTVFSGGKSLWHNHQASALIHAIIYLSYQKS